MELNHKQNTFSQVRQLAGRYARVLSKPSVDTFVEETQGASWGSIWMQLISLGIFGAILQSVYYMVSPAALRSLTGASASSPAALIPVLALLNLILIPASFFAAIGILHLVAKALGGQGRYLEQLYAVVLFGVPLVALSYLLVFIPVVGGWLAYLPHAYSLVLFVISLMAVQKLSLGRTIAVVLIPLAAILLLAIIVVILLVVTLH